MMMNLFNIFDPSTSSFLSLNWMSMMIFLLLFPFQYWLTPSRVMMIPKFLSFILFKEFKILINYSFSNLLLIISLFMFIFLNNFMGLFPYIFNASSHMSFCFPLSLHLWIGLMLYAWTNYLNNTLKHLTPQNTPMILMPFMVIIELISSLIRPLTLSIRLTANMIAGHLLLTLIGSSSLMTSYYFMMMMTSQLIMMMLELAVSIIQAYVFSVLMTLYMSEI